MSKVTFNNHERSSLLIEVILQEIKEDNPEKIKSVFDLLAFLQREKVRVLKVITAEKDQSYWKEINDIDREINDITEYIKLLTTGQLTEN